MSDQSSKKDVRGEFTKKIDQELILRHASASEKQAARIELEKEESHRQLAEKHQQQRREVDVVCDEVDAALRGRTEFLRARFSNMREDSPKGARGIRYVFVKSAEYKWDAFLELRVKDNDSHQALFVESSMEVVGKSAAKNDYITFPVKDMKIDRVKKFVERKILDFIKAYLD